MNALGCLGPGGEAHAVVSDFIKEVAPCSGEGVGDFGGETAGEDAGVLPLLDVFPPTLDEVAGQFIAEGAAFGFGFVFPQGGELRAQEGKEIVEGVVVAGVGGGGEQNEVAVLVGRQLLQEIEAELLSLTGGAGMGFVDDDALRGDGEEVLAVALAFDVIQADHDKGVLVKKAGARRQGSLHAVGAGGGEGDGADVEAVFQFALPLLHEVRRAEDSAARDFATVEQFPDDEGGLDGFPDAHVVGDEQTHHRQTQGHEERDQLIGAGLHGDIAKRAEGAGSVAQFQMDGIAEEGGGLVVAEARGIRKRKGGGFGRGEFEVRQDERDVFFGATEGPQREGIRLRTWLHDPFPATGADKRSGGEGGDHAVVSGGDSGVKEPKTVGWAAKTGGQNLESAGKTITARPRSAA